MERGKKFKDIAYENSQYQRITQDFRSSMEMKDRMNHLHELRMKLPREREK